MTKQGQKPAFPSERPYETGMSKRFYAACAAMTGILSSIDYNDLTFDKGKVIVMTSYRIADELLKQENNEQ